MGTPYALGDLAQFSEAKPPAGPLPGVQELCSVALDGYAPAFGWLGVSRIMALGDLTRFSEAESLVDPLPGVQELCSVALDGQFPKEQAFMPLDWVNLVVLWFPYYPVYHPSHFHLHLFSNKRLAV